MKIQLRSKHGGRLEVLDENGQQLDGVTSVELRALAPDFIPAVRIGITPSVTVNTAAKIVPPASVGGEVWHGTGAKSRKTTANEANS